MVPLQLVICAILFILSILSISTIVNASSSSSVNTLSSAQPRCDVVNQQIYLFNRNISDTARTDKFAQMKANIAQFYRGTDHLYLRDLLQPTIIPLDYSFSSNMTRTFVSGDQHLYNFGSFHNADDDLVYFMNDFDQAFIADYSIDVYRCAVSIYMHAMINNLSNSDANSLVNTFATYYYNTMQSYVTDPGAQLKRVFEQSNTYGRLNNWLADVASKDSLAKQLKKYTTGSPRQFDFTVSGLAKPDAARINAISAAWPDYGASLSGSIVYNPATFAIKSIAARTNAGLGSLGQERYLILIEGPSTSDNDDIILDVKYQPAPQWDLFVTDDVRTFTMQHFTSQAHRVIKAQKALDYRVDSYDGYFVLDQGQTPFSVRTLSPWKESFDIDSLNTSNSFNNMAQQWAQIIATGHARSDENYNNSWIPWSMSSNFINVVGKNVDGFVNVVSSFAANYYQQLVLDYNCFVSNN